MVAACLPKQQCFHNVACCCCVQEEQQVSRSFFLAFDPLRFNQSIALPYSAPCVQSRASAALGEALAEADRLRALVAALSTNPAPNAIQQVRAFLIRFNRLLAFDLIPNASLDKHEIIRVVCQS